MSSRFQRGDDLERARKKQEQIDNSWFAIPENMPLPDDPDYEPMRHDKRRPAQPTAEEHSHARFSIAKAMLRSFGYSPWMANVRGPNGEHITIEGEVEV